MFGAGTDADVFIELKGEKGSFGPHWLPAGASAFEGGCRDVFPLSTPDLGELEEVVIGHNNKGSGAAWYLEALELTNTNTGRTARIGTVQDAGICMVLSCAWTICIL